MFRNVFERMSPKAPMDQCSLMLRTEDVSKSVLRDRLEMVSSSRSKTFFIVFDLQLIARPPQRRHPVGL